MPLIVVGAALAIAASIPLLYVSVAAGRSDQRARLLTGMQAGDLRDVAMTESAAVRVIRPLAGTLARRVKKVTPVGWLEWLDRQIVLAGLSGRWPLERVLATKALAALAGLIVGLLVLRRSVGLSGWMFPAITTALGFFAPDLFVKSRAEERQKGIQTDLPDALDQITMSVEAGLGFEGALARIAHADTGPLADEITRALQEMQIGVPRSEALKAMAARSDVSDLRVVVSAIVQSENYGLPIAQVMRVQAGEMRVKRRQRAEERAMKIPVKIIFPLVFCIFPALFIVILGPAVIRISEALF